MTMREQHTVLAALRLYQEEAGSFYSGTLENRPWLAEIASNGGTVEPLSSEEIDDLCQRINCAPLAK